MFAALAPAVFVVLWSTGFVVARMIAPYADPNLYLLARFGGTALLFTGVALMARVRWPAGRELGKHLLAGALLQGVYLGAGYWAVAQGLSVGVMALLGALQPLLTAVLAARLFRETLSPWRWAGMGLGFAGVVLVLAPKFGAAATTAALAGTTLAARPTPAWLVVAVAITAVCAITAGTLYQKASLVQADIRSASAVQNLGAAIVAALLAAVLGEHRWIATPTLWFSLAWGVLLLSGAGVTLLVWMVRRGDAARATALLFLAPPLAALISYIGFGETLRPLQIAGFALTLTGVTIARRG